MDGLNGIGEDPGVSRQEAEGRLQDAAGRLFEAARMLEETPLLRDAVYQDLRDRLYQALFWLERAGCGACTMTTEELAAVVTAAKRQAEPVWVRASDLQEAPLPAEAEAVARVPA
ncbi:hypothetical protein AN478_04655 [Thiohalorhabdus denitrificans]|nr:hypothetical protein [Thiohalorhabdus denitrificans]KPV41185.1 hypothetical protein AN478_04655 [Thiohalorhabdus denitrificans]